jgi:type IV pilus assembly protein PilM
MKFKLKNPEIKLNPEIRLKRGGDTNLVGLEIEAGSIGAAEIDSDGSSVARVATQALPAGAFDDGEVVDPAALTDAVRSLFEANKLSKRVRLGKADYLAINPNGRLPAIEDPKELDSAIRFSAQEQIAMPLEQAVIDHRVVGGVPGNGESPPQIDVMVVAARRDMIATSLKPLRDAGLEPVGVDLAAFGMIRALGEAASRR